MLSGIIRLECEDTTTVTMFRLPQPASFFQLCVSFLCLCRLDASSRQHFLSSWFSILVSYGIVSLAVFLFLPLAPLCRPCELFSQQQRCHVIFASRFATVSFWLPKLSGQDFSFSETAFNKFFTPVF